MTQKLLTDSIAASLLASLDPETISDEQVRETFKHLLNVIEQLKSKIKELQTENQRLRDENNRLKGELSPTKDQTESPAWRQKQPLFGTGTSPTESA